MGYRLDWENYSTFPNPPGGPYGQYWECRLPVPDEKGYVITALIARIVQENLEAEEAEETGVDEVYKPTLCMEVRHRAEVPVAGYDRPSAPPQREGVRLTMRQLADFNKGDWEAVKQAAAAGNTKLQELATSALSRYYDLGLGEYSFEEAEDCIRDYITEFLAALKADSLQWQESFGSDILSVTDVAEMFAVPRNTVLNWIKAGTLPAFRLGSKYMIERKDLAGAIAQAKSTSRA